VILNNQIRRKLLGVLGRSALFAVTMSFVRTAHAEARVSAETGARTTPPVDDDVTRNRDITEDPLLPEATEWVDRLRSRGTRVLEYPVSRLQREFSLGYSRACALAEQLAQRGEWTVGYDADGTRRARIHRLA
jgi:DNA segregation ATPase FtsK/SpoIIIE-like protein